MHLRPGRIGALLFAGIVVGHVFAQSPTATSSGIEGTIFVAPSHPGPERPGVPSQAAAANVEFVVKNKEEQIASFTTDADGKFKVALPPGHYVVVKAGGGARIGHWMFEADVAAGVFTKVSWTADSGMR